MSPRPVRPEPRVPHRPCEAAPVCLAGYGGAQAPASLAGGRTASPDTQQQHHDGHVDHGCADFSRGWCALPGCSARFGSVRAGNVGGRSQCDSWDPGRCGGGPGWTRRVRWVARSRMVPANANGAPPSMSRRGPTRPRRAGAAGCPASWRSATVRPVWKQQLESRLPGFPVARVSPAFREFPPGTTSALAVTEFVLSAGELAQGFPASNFKIFPGYPRNPQESACYPPGKVTVHRGFHRVVHRPSSRAAGGRGWAVLVRAGLGGPGPGGAGRSWSGRGWAVPVRDAAGPGARRARSWPGGPGVGAGMPRAATRPLHV